MIRIVLFIICTLYFIRVSWRALCNPEAHGFYRFFVFEGVAVLILLNYPYWFMDPFSSLHVVSWVFLFASIFFVIQALLMLKRVGGHDDRHETPENFSFENTVHVVEEGVYRYVRHPMYSSLLFLGWGAFLKHITLFNIVLILLVSAFLIATAKVEERENIRFFGSTYVEYMHRTRMLIPYVF